MQTNTVELKKLVYLYIINYAKTQPDLAILAVNTFVKVCIRLATLRFLTILVRRILKIATRLFGLLRSVPWVASGIWLLKCCARW